MMLHPISAEFEVCQQDVISERRRVRGDGQLSMRVCDVR